jgi:hypothetical protein
MKEKRPIYFMKEAFRRFKDLVIQNKAIQEEVSKRLEQTKLNLVSSIFSVLKRPVTANSLARGLI